jgi:hypothetical protein
MEKKFTQIGHLKAERERGEHASNNREKGRESISENRERER